MGLIASDQFKIIIGLGQTGLACARFLYAKGQNFAVVDSRACPPGSDELSKEMPEIALHCGEFESEFLCQAEELYVSPGVTISHPAIQAAAAQGVKISGDIDLFCRNVSAPIVAITGSNAKSTVTTLVGEMAIQAGLNVGVCGNIGTPVLDMLKQEEKALYVIELSSFQLETTQDLRAEVATVLNVSPDHMDRYASFQDYYQAKHRIFRGAAKVVVNKEDALTAPLLAKNVSVFEYHLGPPDLKCFGLITDAQNTYLGLAREPLIAASELKIRGRHNLANALAALALGTSVGLPMTAMLKALKNFAGLEHRCQWIADLKGVSYFNDSKGTNVGATVAALEGFGGTLELGAKIVLIAGGVGKGADFADLAQPAAQYCRALVYIGEDGERLAQSCVGVDAIAAANMQDAVTQAAAHANRGDIVLLSPACASFDMYSGFPERGQKFAEAVQAL